MRDVEAFLFDLDYTIIDSSPAEPYRDSYQWRKAYEKIPECSLYDGIPTVVRRISDNFQSGVVTNTPESYAEKVLNYFEIALDPLACWHDTENHKPHPEPIRHAVECLGASNSKTVYVGDKAEDMDSVEAAGGRGVGALWDADNPDRVRDREPWAIAEHPSELLNILSLGSLQDS